MSQVRLCLSYHGWGERPRVFQLGTCRLDEYYVSFRPNGVSE